MTDLAPTPSPTTPVAATSPQAPRRRRRVGRGLSLLAPVLTFVGILAAWEIIVRVADVPAYQVPPVTDVISTMFSQASVLLPASWVTTKEILLGFALSIVVGIPLAVAIVTFRALERSIYPLLVASQVVPKVAIAPLFIVWFGFGIFPKVLLVFLIAFFPVVIGSTIGLKSVEIEKLYLARSMGASSLQMFLRFRLPNALPSIFGGVKLSATLAVIGAVVAEFVGADDGLGYVLQQANGNLDTPLLFAAIGYLTILGVLVFAATELLEKLLLPWHVSHRSVPVGSA
jgi:NitT/TauT family transport system permease protein